MTLRFASRWSLLHFGEPDSPYDRALRHFQSSVADTFVTTKAPSTATEQDVLRDVIAGRLFGAILTTGAIATLVPGFHIADLPYVFESTDHARRFWRIPQAAGLVALAAQAGVVLLAFYDAGVRHFFNRVRPLVDPDDIATLRIRTLPNRYHALWVLALGAEPVPMTTASIRDAFARGAIDGAERSYLNYRDLGCLDFAPFLTETAHFHLSACLAVSRSHWETMDARLRERCMAAAQDSEAIERDAYAAADQAAERQLGETTLRIIRPNRNSWRARAGTVIEAFRKEPDGDRLLRAAVTA